ncbi:TetR/AcrR family transcriptional regulator [Mesorhizobium sp. CAU 1741]|uniref:TetR/AcrR family transcriptional regulator n=1 Tax=Mesorhizobium sp. CAU 1741 TaxID=3140366 RepID=UPI00325B360B
MDPNGICRTLRALGFGSRLRDQQGALSGAAGPKPPDNNRQLQRDTARAALTFVNFQTYVSNMELKQPLAKSESTRARILEAAASMFAKNGVTNTTLREITKAAKVNMAAVNYHFGSKEALANGVFRDLADRVNTRRREEIAACVAAAGAKGETPSVADLVDIFLKPYVGSEEPWTSMLLVHLVMLHRVDPTPWTREIIKDQFDPLAGEFIDAMHLALPDFDKSELFWRYYFMPGTVIFALSDAPRSKRLLSLSQGECDTARADALAAQLRSVLINMFEGPPAEPVARAQPVRATVLVEENESGAT